MRVDAASASESTTAATTQKSKEAQENNNNHHHRQTILSVDIGTTNMCVCVVRERHSDEMPIPYPCEVVVWELFSLEVALGAHTEGTQRVCEELWSRFGHLYSELDQVVIESQRASTVSIMHTLQHSVQAHFETVKLIKSLRFVITTSGGDIKLRVYRGTVDMGNFRAATQHAYNKEKVIRQTRQVLRENVVFLRDNGGDLYGSLAWARLLRQFEDSVKKDDLGDSLMLALYHLLRRYVNGVLPRPASDVVTTCMI
jgi:hypothetical protein